VDVVTYWDDVEASLLPDDYRVKPFEMLAALFPWDDDSHPFHGNV
jgi:hypothetical protein